MKENIKCRGDFKCNVYQKNNNEWTLIEIIEKTNQVLNGLLTHITKKLGNDATEPDITKISFGSNNATPNRTDTVSIMQDKFTKTLDGSPTFPAYNKVKYAFELLDSEHNDNIIREYALTLEDGEIICRLTRGTVNKNNTIRLEGSWTLTFDI